MLRQVGMHICWKFRHRVSIRKIAANQFWGSASSGHRGVIPTRGGVISALGVYDRGVAHAGESFTPLRPAFTAFSHDDGSSNSGLDGFTATGFTATQRMTYCNYVTSENDLCTGPKISRVQRLFVRCWCKCYYIIRARLCKSGDV